VIFLKAFSEVQGFSVWRAAGNVLIAIFIAGLPLLALLILAGIAT
jgi:hypothetical protein